MVKEVKNNLHELEVERSSELEKEIDDSCKHMEDDFRMTQAARQITDLQGDYNA